MARPQYHTIGTLFGIRVSVHWTVGIVVALLVVLVPLAGSRLLLVAPAYCLLILAHELGHAAVARRVGCGVYGIRISPVHGVCLHADPRTLFDRCLIAWGGVAGQLVVFAPAALVWHLGGDGDFPPMVRLGLQVLTATNLILIVFNLLPFAPLDGATAWRIFAARWPHRRRKRPPWSPEP